MTESRVEAVARAIDPLAWDELDKLDEAIIPSERLLSRIKASKQTANRAIEANDAWLKEQPNLGKHIYVATLGLTDEDSDQ